jgi:hypothetical protein
MKFEINRSSKTRKVGEVKKLKFGREPNYRSIGFSVCCASALEVIPICDNQVLSSSSMDADGLNDALGLSNDKSQNLVCLEI